MKAIALIAALAVSASVCRAAAPGATAAAPGAPSAAPFELAYKPIAGTYALYGGGLGDPVAPGKADQKIAIAIEGEAAKSLFNAIGPDRKDACGAGGEKGVRARHRDGEKLTCMFYPDAGYHCYVGFDLKTGKSIGGSLC